MLRIQLNATTASQEIPMYEEKLRVSHYTTTFYYLHSEEKFVAHDTLARRKNSFVAQTIVDNNFIFVNLHDQKVRHEIKLSAAIDIIVVQS